MCKLAVPTIEIQCLFCKDHVSRPCRTRTAQGATTQKKSPLHVRGETLQHLIEACGFDKSTTTNFVHNWLPFHHARFEYDDDGKPTFMS